MSDLTLKQVVAWANENNRVVVDSAYLNKLTKRAIDAEEAVRVRDVNDNGLFMEAFKATTRARAMEQRNTVLEEGGRALVAANTKHFDAARAAEQRNIELEGALRAARDIVAGARYPEAGVVSRRAVEALTQIDALLEGEKEKE